MRTLYANRLALLLGSALLCLVGFVSGCDEGSSTPAKLDPTANKAREDAEHNARTAAYGNAGYQAKAVKNAPTPKK